MKVLSEYVQEWRADERKVRAEITMPVLIWGAPPEAHQDHMFTTRSNDTSMSPAQSPLAEPRIFPIAKKSGRPNAFTMGITVGRTENNDIHITNNGISRFHAYFVFAPNTNMWT